MWDGELGDRRALADKWGLGISDFGFQIADFGVVKIVKVVKTVEIVLNGPTC
jgi:hypothetical protein